MMAQSKTFDRKCPDCGNPNMISDEPRHCIFKNKARPTLRCTQCRRWKFLDA